jgi:diadenylate cyclase
MDVLADIARVVRWQDAIDVAILTFIIFRVYLWLRGTVALQVLIGMLVLVASWFAATELGLMLTAYVLQGLGAGVLLLAVVLFRDEIRHALRRANPMRWWRARRDSDGQRGVWSVLGEAVFALASLRIGALIVIPGSDPIDEMLSGGTLIDGRVSPELLEAIFLEASPIHDGAAVMQGERLRLAGCILPLSTAGDLPDFYGTRHRAAVGLTESCDAVVLVVSEERGSVSLASGGRIARVPRADELGVRIEAALARGHAPGPRRATTRGVEAAGFGRRRFVDAAWLAGIFVFVVAAWYVVAGDRNTVITPTVQLELRNLPNGIEVEAPRPAEITIQLRGPRRLLMTTGRDELGAYVNLSGVEPGTHRLDVSSSAPSGVEVESLTPKRVVITARKKVKKSD